MGKNGYHEAGLPNPAIAQETDLQHHLIGVGLRLGCGGGRCDGGSLCQRGLLPAATVVASSRELHGGGGGPVEATVGGGLAGGAGDDLVPEVANYPTEEGDLADDGKTAGVGDAGNLSAKVDHGRKVEAR